MSLLKQISQKTGLSQFRALQIFQKWSTEDDSRLKFYSQFVQSGNLVFDVGANMGNRSKIFVALKAKVVGFEPQNYCAGFLKKAFKNQPLFHLENCALGEQVGESEIFISNANVISSMSTQWIKAVKESGRFSKYNWNKKQSVQISTLEEMIKKYGTPNFMKIDVEGFELNVLKGLKTPVQYISLEFTPELIETTFACMDYLTQFGEYEYNYSMGESMVLENKQWISNGEIKTTLSKFTNADFGDIYLRLK